MTSTSLANPLLPRTLSTFIETYSNKTPSSTSSSSISLPTRATSPTSTTGSTSSQNTKPQTENMTETTSTKPTLMTRLRGPNARTRTVKTTMTVEPRTAHNHNTRTTGRSRWGRSRRDPVVQHKRHATIGDKISGAMMKLKGSLTRRPGVKVRSLHLWLKSSYADNSLGRWY
jgi:hypothetical protein